MDKNELRIKMKKVRKSVLEPQKASDIIQKQLLSLPEVQSADTVFIYVSFGTEVSTHDAIRAMLSQGKTVTVPKTHSDGIMEAVKIDSLDSLKTGDFGAMEPENGENIEKDNINVVIIPAICYDKMGFRLGYGKGFYDRYLEGFAGVKIGLCYDECLIGDTMPAPHDIAADVIVTESKTVRIKAF